MHRRLDGAGAEVALLPSYASAGSASAALPESTLAIPVDSQESYRLFAPFCLSKRSRIRYAESCMLKPLSGA